MTIFAEFTVPAGEFGPESLLATGADVRAELERRVPSGSPVGHVWLVGEDRDAVVDDVAGRSGVSDLQVVDDLPERTLVRLAWPGDDPVWEAVDETGAVLLGAEGDAERWTLRLRFPDRAGLRRFYERVTADGANVTLEQVNGFDAPGTDDRFDLSPTQREAVVAAYERGYFEIPRRTTLEEIAEGLGVSDQAVSERLRRGLETLLEAVALEDAADGTAGPATGSRADHPPAPGEAAGGSGDAGDAAAGSDGEDEGDGGEGR